MPIYEYACHDCRMVFQFFAKSANTDKTPACPKCGKADIERLLSSFAAIGATKKSGGDAPATDGADGADDPFANMSPRQQAAAEREMARLMRDAENIDENDPRQLGSLMERMTSLMGEDADPQMQEAIRRLKAGEDPEKIEEDMGDIFGDEGEGGDSGGMGGMGGYGYDSGLYDM